MKLATPLLFMQKNVFDKNFFRKIESARKRERIAAGAGAGGGGFHVSPKFIVGIALGIACHLQQQQHFQ